MAICKACDNDHDGLACSKVIGINRTLELIKAMRIPTPIQCECLNCGTRWRDVAYGIVKNSIYTYDFCSKCYTPLPNGEAA